MSLTEYEISPEKRRVRQIDISMCMSKEPPIKLQILFLTSSSSCVLTPLSQVCFQWTPSFLWMLRPKTHQSSQTTFHISHLIRMKILQPVPSKQLKFDHFTAAHFVLSWFALAVSSAWTLNTTKPLGNLISNLLFRPILTPPILPPPILPFPLWNFSPCYILCMGLLLDFPQKFNVHTSPAPEQNLAQSKLQKNKKHTTQLIGIILLYRRLRLKQFVFPNVLEMVEQLQLNPDHFKRITKKMLFLIVPCCGHKNFFTWYL